VGDVSCVEAFGSTLVVYATTGENATKVFLVRVSGNAQRVVCLEDQFDHPVAGASVTAMVT
jgi:hypothetical protein